jgi:glycosyltransferase involved in cell wall biosynthesis
MKSDVTVCVPTFPAREHLLHRAVESIRTQSYRPVEVCIASDHDAEGAAPTRNRAWRLADTEWVAFLDDDDELLPNHIESLRRCADETNADLVYPWFTIVDNVGNDITRNDPLRIQVGNKLVTPFGLPFGDLHREELLTRNNFIPITVLVRRTLLEEVGGFPTLNSPEWPENCCEDWALWRKLLNVGATFAHVPERTWRWHWHGGNTSGRPWKHTGSRRRR